MKSNGHLKKFFKVHNDLAVLKNVTRQVTKFKSYSLQFFDIYDKIKQWENLTFPRVLEVNCSD